MGPVQFCPPVHAGCQFEKWKSAPISKILGSQQRPLWDPSRVNPHPGHRHPHRNPLLPGAESKTFQAAGGNEFPEGRGFEAGHSKTNTPRFREINNEATPRYKHPLCYCPDQPGNQRW